MTEKEFARKSIHLFQDIFEFHNEELEDADEIPREFSDRYAELRDAAVAKYGHEIFRRERLR